MLLESIMISALAVIIVVIVGLLLIKYLKEQKAKKQKEKDEQTDRNNKDKEAFEVLNPIGCYFDEDRFRVLCRERKSLDIKLLVEEFNIKEISDKLNDICNFEEKERYVNPVTNGTVNIVENYMTNRIKQIANKCDGDVIFKAKRINEANYCFFSILNQFALNMFLSELEKEKELDKAKVKKLSLDEKIKWAEEKSEEINRNARVDEKNIQHKKDKEQSR